MSASSFSSPRGIRAPGKFNVPAVGERDSGCLEAVDYVLVFVVGDALLTTSMNVDFSHLLLLYNRYYNVFCIICRFEIIPMSLAILLEE